MAIENEFKYLVGTDVTTKFLEKVKANFPDNAVGIEQHYALVKPKVEITDDKKHIITWVVNGVVVPITTMLDESDFQLLGGKAKELPESTVRVRKVTRGARNAFLSTAKLFTGGVLVEIEREISQHEFELIGNGPVFTITKTRYTIPHGDLVFEVDFFYSQSISVDKPFLSLVEVEVPPGVSQRPKLPKYIEEYVVKYIPQASVRYNNSEMVDSIAIAKRALNDTTIFRSK